MRPHVSGVVYAIGDLHGRLDLFEKLIDLVREDAAGLAAEEQPVIVLLGDYIDRGPESAGCIERSVRLCAETWCSVKALKGNHEEALLLFLKDVDVGRNWIQHGGAATLQSYGVDLTSQPDWSTAQAAFARAFPPEHLRFMLALQPYYQQGDYVFVHAGVRPGRALEQQSEADLLWIREAFLNVETPLEGKVVVHGHTPTPGPELKRGRINVDTGAYASGVLTAVRLRGFERTILQAR